MNISDILRHKTSAGAAADRPGIVTIGPAAKVAELVAELERHNVGALVVLDGEQVVGIASERDVVRRLAEHGADLLDRAVSSIMTSPVTSCGGEDSIDTVAETMTERRIRHMPVLDGERLVGIVSIGDVVSSRMRQLEHDRGQLEQYISS